VEGPRAAGSRRMATRGSGPGRAPAGRCAAGWNRIVGESCCPCRGDSRRPLADPGRWGQSRWPW
jgi:hypothetical protein